MDRAKIDAFVKGMREKYPAMFSHHGARLNELWMGDEPIEFAMFNRGIYKQKGLKSIRASEQFDGDYTLQVNGKVTKLKVAQVSFFVDIQEYARVILELEEKNPIHPEM